MTQEFSSTSWLGEMVNVGCVMSGEQNHNVNDEKEYSSCGSLIFNNTRCVFELFKRSFPDIIFRSQAK